VKKALGRTVPEHTVERRRVRIGGPPTGVEKDVLTLVVTSERDQIDPRADYPIEHVLAGSSERYRERRLEIVGRYYELVG
jgi:hypothetical protein